MNRDLTDKAKSGHHNIYEGIFWNLSTKSEQVEWRRSKVVEMRARGMSQIEIAHELQVSKASIISDVQYLCEQAKGTIKEYVIEYLPYK
jgi:DNA-binding NarL/FixJ family response regulator